MDVRGRSIRLVVEGGLSEKGEVVVLIIKASRYCVVSVFLDVDFLLN